VCITARVTGHIICLRWRRLISSNGYTSDGLTGGNPVG
jgi:hypothetical protein